MFAEGPTREDRPRAVGAVGASAVRAFAEHILTERIITSTMQEVRRRLRERAKSAGPEIAAATKQAAKLRAEIAKLGAALLTADSKPTTVMK